MSGDFGKDKKLMAKAFYSHFSAGENLLDGWEAQPIGGFEYLVKRSNGSEIVLSIGQTLDKVGEVSLDKNKNLQVGKWTVIVGENMIKGWEAKSIRGKGNYLIKKIDGPSVKVSIGDNIDGYGKLEYDKNGNLSAGGNGIRIAKKSYELSLIILKEKDKGGFVSYFNYLEPGNSGNRNDGVKGIFHPSPDGKQPGRFSEFSNDGNLYTTAVFWPSKDKKFARGQIRGIDKAIEESIIFKQVKEIEKEAKESNIEPEFIYGYEEKKKELDELNKKSWKESPFSVTEGKKLFGLDSGWNKSREKDNSPGP